MISNEKYPTIAEDYYKSFQLLKSLPCDVFLASHAAFFGLSEKMKLREQGKIPNPFIDPQGYQAYIEEAYSAYQEQL